VRFPDDGVVLHFRVPKAEFDSLPGEFYGHHSYGLLAFLRMNRSGGTVDHGFDLIEGPLLLNPKKFLKGELPDLGGNQVVFFGEKGSGPASMLNRGLQP
jgi:hypothetical protein